MLRWDASGPARATDLVARLGMDMSTVSRQVASLVALGLVERVPHPGDGRVRPSSISAEGSADRSG
nr:helix-turn-helix domain-containing protein [Modestobacter marinus]